MYLSDIFRLKEYIYVTFHFARSKIQRGIYLKGIPHLLKNNMVKPSIQKTYVTQFTICGKRFDNTWTQHSRDYQMYQNIQKILI